MADHTEPKVIDENDDRYTVDFGDYEVGVHKPPRGTATTEAEAIEVAQATYKEWYDSDQRNKESEADNGPGETQSTTGNS